MLFLLPIPLKNAFAFDDRLEPFITSIFGQRETHFGGILFYLAAQLSALQRH
jgi:hypothetical protein